MMDAFDVNGDPQKVALWMSDSGIPADVCGVFEGQLGFDYHSDRCGHGLVLTGILLYLYFRERNRWNCFSGTH